MFLYLTLLQKNSFDPNILITNVAKHLFGETASVDDLKKATNLLENDEPRKVRMNMKNLKMRKKMKNHYRKDLVKIILKIYNYFREFK